MYVSVPSREFVPANRRGNGDRRLRAVHCHHLPHAPASVSQISLLTPARGSFLRIPWHQHRIPLSPCMGRQRGGIHDVAACGGCCNGEGKSDQLRSIEVLL